MKEDCPFVRPGNKIKFAACSSGLELVLVPPRNSPENQFNYNLNPSDFSIIRTPTLGIQIELELILGMWIKVLGGRSIV